MAAVAASVTCRGMSNLSSVACAISLVEAAVDAAAMGLMSDQDRLGIFAAAGPHLSIKGA